MYFKSRCLIIFVFILLVANTNLFANYNDSLKGKILPLKYLNLNSDSVLDTVYGNINLNGVKPVYISWGVDSVAIKDTTKKNNKYIKNRKERTYFKYPKFDSLTVSTTFIKFNEDTISDLLITARGLKKANNIIKDTLIRYLIFGQNDIGIIDTLHIYDKDGETTSFIYKNLDTINDLKLVNNYTFGKSLFILKLSNQLISDSTYKILLNDLIENEEKNNEFQISIFPNPSNQILTIKINKIVNNSLNQLKVISLNGEILKNIYFSENLRDNKEISLPIDDISNGSYFVVLYFQNNITKTSIFTKIN